MKRTRMSSAYCHLAIWALVVSSMLATGCTSTPPTPTVTPSATALPTATTAPVASSTPDATDGGRADADPVAQEIHALARTDLAKLLQIDTTSIELVELVALTWPDTSMGCPQMGQDYETITMPGYRLVFSVDDETHIYHASFESVFYCDAEDEVLPDTTAP